MFTPNLPAIHALCPVWNNGRGVGQKRPLTPQHVWAIRVRLELAENHSDLVLFKMVIDSKLLGYDLVEMKVVDVMASGQIKARSKNGHWYCKAIGRNPCGLAYRKERERLLRNGWKTTSWLAQSICGQAGSMSDVTFRQGKTYGLFETGHLQLA